MTSGLNHEGREEHEVKISERINSENFVSFGSSWCKFLSSIAAS